MTKLDSNGREEPSRGTERRGGLAERLLAIGKDCASRLGEPIRSIDHGEMLYGEDGLPRRPPPPRR